ncbi:MAG: hypothetical protein INR64_15725 [Caulobacteraceae bacterium]|nr:hypothetical protein [Caulobacter sp.]
MAARVNAPDPAGSDGVQRRCGDVPRSEAFGSPGREHKEVTPMKTIAAAAALGLAALSAVPAAAQVNAREYNQQRRIDQGVRSGALTPGEAARDERQQGRIDSTVARERARNGGYLTPYQRARINQRENRASAHIYRSKHNWRGY